MRKVIGFLLVSMLLAGCVPYGRDFNTAPVRSIQNNVTTQREIFNYFGEPYSKGLENGYQTWSYTYSYWEFGQLRDSRELSIVFNKDHTVRSYSFAEK
jgi:hypothetical protein